MQSSLWSRIHSMGGQSQTYSDWNASGQCQFQFKLWTIIRYCSPRSDLYTFTNDWAKTFSNRQELEMTHNDKWNVWGNFMPGLMMGHQVLYGYRFTVVQ